MCNKSTDIVFVTPSKKPDMRQESIGTLILAQKAYTYNFKVAIVRFWEASQTNYNVFAEELCDRIFAHNPQIVSFYCRGNEYHILIDLAQRIKKISNITIVFGGPQAELVAEDTLNLFPCVDYICCGEGENTIVPLLHMILHNNKDDAKLTIPGLVYRNDNGTIRKNKLPDLLPDNYTHNDLYYNLVPENVIRNSRSVTIDVGRGCPFSCTFCSTKTFWKQKYRLRDLTDTIYEIEYVVNHYGNKLFSFSHDLFTVNKNRVLCFCDKLKESGISIKWTCSARIDCIDENLIEKMSAAGLVGIYYGIESGSERMQKKINKNLNIQRCKEIVKCSIHNKVTVTASFIYGFPGETFDDLNKTLELIHQLEIIGADVQLHHLSFEKGSKLYDDYNHKLSFSFREQHNEFGVKELSDKISKYPELFSTFWNYSSTIRNEMKYLDIFHAIGREYKDTYVLLISILINKGLSYVEAFKLVIGLIQDSLIRFEQNNVAINKSICCFLFEKIISRLSVQSNLNIRITENESLQLRSLLLRTTVSCSSDSRSPIPII